MQFALLLGIAAGCAPVSVVNLQIPVTGVANTGQWSAAAVEISDLRLHWPSTAGLTPLTAAWAHPGHGVAGDVGAELLGQWQLDDEPRALGELAAYAGHYVEASFTVHTVELTRDGETLALDVDQDVTGLPVSLRLRGPEQLTLTWSADAALSEADPDAITDEAVRFGVVSTRAWMLEAH
ncbi:MAG: hypothetical protein ACI8PZ_000889 [Myxococcota bacterium]|jgi:hypothetical protein